MKFIASCINAAHQGDMEWVVSHDPCMILMGFSYEGVNMSFGFGSFHLGFVFYLIIVHNVHIGYYIPFYLFIYLFFLFKYAFINLFVIY